MKRFFSWSVLLLSVFIFNAITSAATWLLKIIISYFLSFNTTVRIIVFVLFAPELLYFFLLVPFYYASCVYSLSEAVSTSLKGTRYYLFGGYYIIYAAIVSIMFISKISALNTISAGYLISLVETCIMGFTFIHFGKKSKENFNSLNKFFSTMEILKSNSNSI